MTFVRRAGTFFGGHLDDRATSASQPHAGPQETEHSGRQ